MPQNMGVFGFNPGEPVAVIEGRAPLHNQRFPRQEYLSNALGRKYGVQVLLIQAQDPTTYDEDGLIRTFTVYGGGPWTLEEGIYAPAWRLRDVIWREGGNKLAFLPGRGYNFARLRQDLKTRLGLGRVLDELGFSGQSVESVAFDGRKPGRWPEETHFFLKPNVVMDVGADPSSRAQLVRRDELTPAFVARFGDAPVLQAVEPGMGDQDLLGALGLAPSDRLGAGCLHALRIYQPLWLPSDQAPAAELRLSNPEDVGERFATELHLLEPEQVFDSFPSLRKLHGDLHAILASRYGALGYPAIDYIIGPDGSTKILNVLARPLTPNLEGQRDDVMHLAQATADVEVLKLAELAHDSFQWGPRP
ncbi:MAG TPA: hypothetical protein VMT30_04800 [Candidatus Saccharimonadia bacterium]|nr:hypothetical protein [Candidatus Saccharimonadia bacterium]